MNKRLFDIIWNRLMKRNVFFDFSRSIFAVWTKNNTNIFVNVLINNKNLPPGVHQDFRREHCKNVRLLIRFCALNVFYSLVTPLLINNCSFNICSSYLNSISLQCLQNGLMWMTISIVLSAWNHRFFWW